MKTKGVSFNVENPEDKALLEKALTYRNFSGKVKEWIRLDIERENARNRQRTDTGGIRINLT
jgi:hypothetical protein